MPLSYRLISATELDATLLGAWRKIQSTNSEFASPYFCPEFTQLVGEVRNDVRVVVIEDNTQIVGFFPYQRSILGMGRPVGGPLSDYHGVIAAPSTEWAINPLMQAAKLRVWSFNHLLDPTCQFDSFAEATTSSPQIDLSSGYAQYARARREAGSDYIRKTEGLARKLGREVGELRFTLHEAGGEGLRQLIEWKSGQYREGRLPDAFAVPWTGKLLNRISATQTSGFAGVCSVLRAGDRMVAIHMGMRSAKVLHYWFPAYDPEFAKFSTGIILLLRMAEALSAQGISTIDLGGGKSQYKERLMTGEVSLGSGSVELPSVITAVRRLQRTAEVRAARRGVPAVFHLPFRVIKRIERKLRYR